MVGEMKAKQLPKGTWSKSIQYFYSLKNSAYSWCESQLERDALLILEFDDEIESYKSQPISIQYKNTLGETCRYTPDYLFKRKVSGKFIFREVKMFERINDELKEKVVLINRRLTSSYDSKLEIISSNEIRVGSRIDNLDMLYSYRRVQVDPSHANGIINRMPSEFPYAELIDAAKKAGEKNVIPLCLLAHGYLCFDMTSPLASNTRINKK